MFDFGFKILLFFICNCIKLNKKEMCRFQISDVQIFNLIYLDSTFLNPKSNIRNKIMCK